MILPLQLELAAGGSSRMTNTTVMFLVKTERTEVS